MGWFSAAWAGVLPHGLVVGWAMSSRGRRGAALGRSAALVVEAVLDRGDGDGNGGINDGCHASQSSQSVPVPQLSTVTADLRTSHPLNHRRRRDAGARARQSSGIRRSSFHQQEPPRGVAVLRVTFPGRDRRSRFRAHLHAGATSTGQQRGGPRRCRSHRRSRGRAGSRSDPRE